MPRSKGSFFCFFTLVPLERLELSCPLLRRMGFHQPSARGFISRRRRTSPVRCVYHFHHRGIRNSVESGSRTHIASFSNSRHDHLDYLHLHSHSDHLPKEKPPAAYLSVCCGGFLDPLLGLSSGVLVVLASPCSSMSVAKQRQTIARQTKQRGTHDRDSLILLPRLSGAPGQNRGCVTLIYTTVPDFSRSGTKIPEISLTGAVLGTKWQVPLQLVFSIRRSGPRRLPVRDSAAYAL